MRRDNKEAQSILKSLTIREAIASVSLSHDPRCNCLTCRAGKGDEQAITELLAELGELPG